MYRAETHFSLVCISGRFEYTYARITHPVTLLPQLASRALSSNKQTVLQISPVNREIAPIKNHKENCKTGYDFTIMGKRLIYAKITCVAGLSLFSFTLNTAVKASGLLYILRTKFRYLSATVRRESALGSMTMFTSALGLPRLIKTLLCMFCSVADL